MTQNKLTIDDIFNDEDFKKLCKEKLVKTEYDRLIDAFEEVNVFIDKNDREPSGSSIISSMSEYSLMARLKHIRQDKEQKKILIPFDRHNLLGDIENSK
jgi:hypothetical protein